MKKIMLLTLAVVMCLSVLWGCDNQQNVLEDENNTGNQEGNGIGVFDCYFNLETFKGLELYVWKTEDEAYFCGLMSGTNRSKEADEIAKLPPATIDEMKAVIATYDLSVDSTTIIPIKHPLCLYEWELDDAEIQKLKEMFGIESVVDTMQVYEAEVKNYYDTISFDIDNDGIEELCTLGYGRTSGVFSFTMTAKVDGRIKYGKAFVTDLYNLSFAQRDGKLYVQGISQITSPKTQLFDILVENGDIALSFVNENSGKPEILYALPMRGSLEEITLDNYSLDFIKHNNYVVMENSDVTVGQEIWADFVATTERGESASVRYAQYYTLNDPSHYSAELYEEIKDDYPCMYVHELSFDGEKYTDVHYEGETKYEESYKYIVKYEGEPSSSSASFSSYTYYVLIDDKELTWKDCESAMLSSLSTDSVRFLQVYSDLVY